MLSLNAERSKRVSGALVIETEWTDGTKEDGVRAVMGI